MNYFTNCETLADLKARFRELAQQHHPDHGGSTETMQQINAQYTDAVKMFSRYGNIPKNERRQAAYTRKTSEQVNRAIEAVQNLPGITVELVGLWVWVSGNTYPHREVIRAAGFQWASKKRMWYFKGCESRGYGRPMDEIRDRYGVTVIKEQKQLA